MERSIAFQVVMLFSSPDSLGRVGALMRLQVRSRGLTRMFPRKLFTRQEDNKQNEKSIRTCVSNLYAYQAGVFAMGNRIAYRWLL